MTSSVTFDEMKTNILYTTLRQVAAPDYSLYVTYGKTDEWSNEASPPAPNVTTSQIYSVWNNMIGAKRLFGGDLCAVVKRYNWTSGETYTAYDDQIEDIANTKFYAMTTDYNVYKCIANNNGGTATVKPTSVDPVTVQKTSDGYAWKYMYSISDADQLRFMTNEYIPVRQLVYDDGSTQWKVQSETIPGTIEVIKILNGGTNYSNASNVSVAVSGDGSRFAGQVTTNGSQSIVGVTVVNPGINYSYADVTFKDASGTPGSNASARAVISYPGGHGSNPLYELYAKNIMIDARIKYDEEGYLPVTNDYRQIALIANPVLNKNNQRATGYLADNPEESELTSPISKFSAVLQAYTLICAGFGDFQENELVYQGSSFETRTFEGVVLSWNSSTNKLLLINTKGNLSVTQYIFGDTSLSSRVVTSYDSGVMKPYSGNMLYVNNLKPITRSFDQIEEFKILVRF